MTEISSETSARALDAYDLLPSIEELAAALRRLGAVNRMMAAEHARLFGMHTADRRAVLDGWRATLDVLGQVMATVETAVAQGQDALYAAARHLEDLPPKPRST